MIFALKRLLNHICFPCSFRGEGAFSYISYAYTFWETGIDLRCPSFVGEKWTDWSSLLDDVHLQNWANRQEGDWHAGDGFLVRCIEEEGMCTWQNITLQGGWANFPVPRIGGPCKIM